MTTQNTLKRLNLAILTVSDTRTDSDDLSGKALAQWIEQAGHCLKHKSFATDNVYQIRAIVSPWIASDDVDVIITTGGTGVTGRDVTPEAIEALLDKKLAGFGELFRYLSYEQVQTASLQSRALAGVANGTYLFCLPGSLKACQLAWEKLLKAQLDANTRPCNLVMLMPRLKEQ